VAYSDPRAAIERSDVEVVVVATTHDALASTAQLAAECGKHVLVEKPAARRASELRPVLAAASRQSIVAKVGFNHRFHPAMQRARQIVDADGIGPLTYIRARYGHGGRPGYDREWRADPQIAGGGELLDQGTHLIDLARWFVGDFVDVTGHLGTYFWDMPVEDNAFALLKTAAGQVAWLHASWTEWKNLFSFEVFGTRGKRLTYYRMLPELGPPETTSWEYPGADRSWADEFAHFVGCIESGSPVCGSLDDALAALLIVERLYSEGRR
jgi:predicted dehydrogenase